MRTFLLPLGFHYENLRHMRPIEIRNAEGLTLEEMSKRLGFAKGYLSEVENGKKQGSRKLFEAYLREFGAEKVTYNGFFSTTQ